MQDNDDLIQFSIYKINIEKVEEKIKLNDNDNGDIIKNKIIKYIKNKIKKRKKKKKM